MGSISCLEKEPILEIYQNKYQYMVHSPSQKIQSIIQLLHFTLGSCTVDVNLPVFRFLCLRINVGIVSAQCYRIGVEVSTFGEQGRE